MQSFLLKPNAKATLQPRLCSPGHHPRPFRYHAVPPRHQAVHLPLHHKQRRATHLRASADAAYDDTRDAPAPKAWQPSFLDTSYDKEIVSLAIPALASMLLDPLMSAINTGIIGHLGTQSLAAVSIGSMAVSFSTLIFSFMLFLTTPRVAAAVAVNDTAKVSKISAASLWISCTCGILTSILMFIFAGDIMTVLRPPEAAVMAQATTFIRVRALGVVPSLCIMTCAGIYRGFKDTRTPLLASAATATTSLILNVVLVFGLKMGVMGAAVATTSAQWVAFTALLLMLVRGGRLQLADLLRPPPASDVTPILRAGFLLSGRTIVSFGLVMYTSTLCVRAGATMQGAFEVVRQLWILTIQFFECLNVACQAMTAAYLGSQDYPRARGVLSRITFLGSLSGAAVGLLLWLGIDPIVNLFTKDASVIREVLRTMPLMCAFFPLDAIGSIMDGGLFASQQTDYLTAVQVSGAAVQYAVLLWVIASRPIDALSIWATLKVMPLLRVGFGLYRNFFSPKSGFRALPAPAATP